MRHLDLFSGIGGFALAARANGHETVCFVEIDKFCQRVLAKNFPGVPIVEDIRGFDGTAYQSVDLLTAGVPCQPASCAGKRRGTEDDRWLWPETYRVIREAKPRWIILENVRGLLTLQRGVVFEDLLLELESYGYETRTFIIPACSLGAPHRRDRVWIVANRASEGPQGRGKAGPETATRDARWGRPADSDRGDAADTSGQGLPEREVFAGDLRQERQATIRGTWDENWYEVAARLCGVDARTPRGVDRHRVNRLKALGNAIVWPIAAEIMRGMP